MNLAKSNGIHSNWTIRIVYLKESSSFSIHPSCLGFPSSKKTTTNNGHNRRPWCDPTQAAGPKSLNFYLKKKLKSFLDFTKWQMFFWVFENALRIQICPEKGISLTILFWGWDSDHQSYSREGSGFLGMINLCNTWFSVSNLSIVILV